MLSIIPAMAVPALCTLNLQRLIVYYRDVLGFDLKQAVPAVLAVVQRGPLRLQLWQRPDAIASDIRIALQGSLTEFFELHAALARHATRANEMEPPSLRPWAAWEFGLTDAEGNRLTLTHWVVHGNVRQLQDPHGGGRGRHPAP